MATHIVITNRELGFFTRDFGQKVPNLDMHLKDHK
jgi:hypothetical protein